MLFHAASKGGGGVLVGVGYYRSWASGVQGSAGDQQGLSAWPGRAPTRFPHPGACPAAGGSSGRTDVDTTPTFLSRPQPTGFASSRPGLTGASKPGKKGMQLGKAKKTNDFLDSLRAEVSTA